MNEDKRTKDWQQTFIQRAQRIQNENQKRTSMIKLRNRISGLFLTCVVGSICV